MRMLLAVLVWSTLSQSLISMAAAAIARLSPNLPLSVATEIFRLSFHLSYEPFRPPSGSLHTSLKSEPVISFLLLLQKDASGL